MREDIPSKEIQDMRIKIKQTAKAYSRILREWLNQKEIASIVRGDSHPSDYCDENMALVEAIEETTKKPFFRVMMELGVYDSNGDSNGQYYDDFVETLNKIQNLADSKGYNLSSF